MFDSSPHNALEDGIRTPQTNTQDYSMLASQLPSVLYAGMLLISPDIPSITKSSLPQPPKLLVPSPSSNAARLLVEPKGGSFARMANPQSFQNDLALQQLSQQRALQDARLEQCQEKQEDFEQCFFYGTGGIDRIDGIGLVGGGLVGARYPSNAGLTSESTNDHDSSAADSMKLSRKQSKTAVPTW